VPLFGHGSVKNDRQRIYQALYTYASGLWVEKGLINHLITLFCKDKVSVDTWLSLGFGNRCIDAIRSTETICDLQELDGYSFIKANKKHLPDIAQLCLQDGLHFKNAPLFMVGDEKSVEDIMHDFAEWLSEDNHHLWIAYEKGQAVGYMRIQENGESFISEHPDMMNITGAYVTNECRGKGVAKYLLNRILIWLNKKGYSICGVDYESINVSGNNFWHKYFKPYTYSMFRHIDDRILK
jgi:GNAT superfamily N-acetyltransferase